MVRQRPDLALQATEVLLIAADEDDSVAFLTQALASVAGALGASAASILRCEGGKWRPLARFGPVRPISPALLAEAMDRGGPRVAENKLVAPLGSQAPDEALVVELGSTSAGNSLLAKAAALTLVVGAALRQVRDRAAERQRAARIDAILGITNRWHETHEMEPLLVQMAEAATRLLGADRASIFLWDRPNQTLVGRPALGAPGGELRIPDDVGVVGQVIRSGEPRRATIEHQAEINRQVDRQLNYETRTLLCVPLRDSDGELLGAFEVINKLSGNFTAEDEAALVELAAYSAVALANTQQFERLLSSHRHLVEQAAERVQLIGASPPVEALRSIVRRVAETELALLILGENGTGKEVVSQLIHYLSPRRERPFIAVNCAAITETLLESELFGHEKGAFTDAHESHRGKFELASGGTLFLDEIGDLSLSGQAKMLRVLEEKIVVRVGGSKPIHTDVRVIAATNQNLAEMVRQKRFRADLYFRLNVVTLELPPLRDRGDDVTLLAEHFLADFCRRAHRKPLKLTAAARKRLQAHAWPGNVRELRNLMERLAYLLAADKVDADDLSFILSPGAEPPPLAPPNLALAVATDSFQIDYIKQTIERAQGNMSLAAERLGLHRSNLYRKMRQLGMPTSE